MPDDYEERLAENVDAITLQWQQVLTEIGQKRDGYGITMLVAGYGLVLFGMLILVGLDLLAILCQILAGG